MKLVRDAAPDAASRSRRGHIRPFLKWFPYILLSTIYCEKPKIAKMHLTFFDSILHYLQRPDLLPVLKLMAIHCKMLTQDVMIEFLNTVIAGLINNKCSPERIVELVGILKPKRQFHPDRYQTYHVWGDQKKQKSKLQKRREKLLLPTYKTLRIAMMARISMIFESLSTPQLSVFADTNEFFKVDHFDFLNNLVNDHLRTTPTGNPKSTKKIKRLGLRATIDDLVNRNAKETLAHEKKMRAGADEDIEKQYAYIVQCQDFGDSALPPITYLKDFVRLTKKEYFVGFSALNKRELIEWIVVRS